MAYRSMAQLEGVLEDVLLKVGKSIFPMDFVIMKMEEDTQVPLLLGRPVLATGAALIDVQKGELTLRVGNEVMHFNLNRSLEHPDVDAESCMAVENTGLLSVELNYDFTLQHSDSCHGRVSGINKICFLYSSYCRGSNTGMGFHPKNDLHQCGKW